MVIVSLSLGPGGLSEFPSEGVKVGLSAPEGLGGGCFLGDFQAGLYQSEEGSQLEVGNDPWWSPSLLP